MATRLHILNKWCDRFVTLLLLLFLVAAARGQAPDTGKTVARHTIKTDGDREYTLAPGENMAEKIRRNLFIRVKTSKNACYVNEPILVTYILYSRLVSEYTLAKQPLLSGFSVYNMMSTGVQQPSSVEMVGGKSFATRVLYKVQLIPLREGELELDPIEIVNKIQFVKKTGASLKEGNSLDDLMNQLNKEETAPKIQESYTLQSKPVILPVKPLPPAPADSGHFTGGVGHYSIQASLDAEHMEANDAPVLKLVIKGWGNLPYIDAPAIPWPAGIEVYDVRTEEDLNKQAMPLSGSKTFLYTFTSKTPGNYTIPPVKFSYFDVVSKTYITAQSQPYNLYVKALAPKADSNASAAAAPKDALNKAAVVEPASYTRYLPVAGILLLVLITGLGIYIWRRKAVKKKIVAPVPVPEEPVIVKDPLAPAHDMLANNNLQPFYFEITTVLWNKVADTYGIPYSELNKQTVAAQLHQRDWREKTIHLFLDVITECEMNLYMPNYQPALTPEELLDKTRQLLFQFRT
jgi:hypothetical protein